MKLTLQAYEKKTINSSGGYFTVLSVDGDVDVELSFKGAEDIPLERGTQIKIGDVAQVVLQNITDSVTTIDFNISSIAVERKAQAVKSEITNALTIASMPAVQVETSIQASAMYETPDDIIILPDETKLILSIDAQRDSCMIHSDIDAVSNLRVVGNATDKLAGGILPPGGSVTRSTQSALYIYNPGGVNAVVGVEIFRRNPN